MLTKIDITEVPDQGGRQRSEMRLFAHETLKEFVAKSQIGEIFEVTGFPVVDEDEVKNANKLMNAFCAEFRFVPCEDSINRFRRKGRVFLERKEPFRPKNIRKPNPYPFD